MGYLKVDDQETRIYIEDGMDFPLQKIIKNAKILQALVGKPVGAIVQGTQGLSDGARVPLLQASMDADALNEYTYRSLNDQGATLIVTHGAGNNDAVKAMQLGKQLGHQYPNLSLLSLGSPLSDRKMQVASSDAGVNYLGQVNDWRDPVTHPKLWVLGTGVAGVGGLAAGIAAAPNTGGGSLIAYISAFSGGSFGFGVGLGMGSGLGVLAINKYHAMSNYFSKPKSQSIMFDWIKNQNE